MKKILRIATNKFLLTALAFGVWMVFFDQNDWMAMQEKGDELQDVKNNISYLEKEITKMEKDHAGIVSDPAQLEKYAREQYRMKRDNEDVYVIQ